MLFIRQDLMFIPDKILPKSRPLYVHQINQVDTMTDNSIGTKITHKLI